MSRSLIPQPAGLPRQRSLLAGLLLALLVVLTGCLKYDLTVVVADDDTMDGTLIVAIAREFAAGQDIFGQTGDLNPSQGSVTKEPYEDADYIGSRYLISGVPISDIDSLSTDSSTRFSLTREGQEYVLDATINFDLAASEALPTQGSFTAMVSFTFPGAVTNANGTIDGNTVLWSQLRPDAENTLTARASALPNGQAASAATSGIAWWVWVLGGAGALMVGAIVAIVVLSRRRRAKAAQAGASGAWPVPLDRYDQYGIRSPTTGYGPDSGYYDSGPPEDHGSYYGSYGNTPNGVTDYLPDGSDVWNPGAVGADTYAGPPGTLPRPQPAYGTPGYPQDGNAWGGYPSGSHRQDTLRYPDTPPLATGWEAERPR